MGEQRITGSAVVIDDSEIKEVPSFKPSRWAPPRHVYFGPKDPDTGEPLPEPTYVYKEFPLMLYKLEGRKLKVVVAKDGDEKGDRIGQGYRLSPADWGIVTCPSFDQLIEIRALEAGAELDAVAEVTAVPELSVVEGSKPAPKKRRTKRKYTRKVA